MKVDQHCPRCGSALLENESFLACPSCLSLADSTANSGTSWTFLRNRLEVHDRLGDYEILAEIARGGMGMVYRARQPRLNRTVALKVMLPGIFSNPAQVQRFKAEAQIVAGLNHPNIISVYEIGEDNGTCFFSMQFVQGQDLSRKGRIDCRTAASYLQKISEAVYHAHQRGVLHRDLKPSNILIDEQNEPRVVDFGIAKLTAESSGLTQTGESLGTPSFMAPEQVHPDGQSISVATDIYALGGILYFLLTGAPPFTGATRDQVMWSVFYDEPIKPTAVDPMISRDLETIVLKCLAKDPAQRYATAGDLAADLQRYQNGEPITARPVSAGRRAWMWARRNPALAACASALAAALVYGVVAQQMALHQARKARADAETLIEFMDKELTTKVRPLGRLDLTADVIRKAEAYFRDQDESKSGPSFLIRKASFFWRAGNLQRDLGKFSEAEEMGLKGLATLDRFRKTDSQDSDEFSLRANLDFLLFRVSENLGNTDQAMDYAHRALSDQRRAVDLAPGNPKVTAGLSEILLEVSRFYRGAKDLENADALLKEASEILRPVAQRNKNDLEIQRLLAITHYHKGLAFQDARDNTSALREFTSFVQGLEAISHVAADDHDWQYELAVAYARAASAYYALGSIDVCRSLVEKWRSSARKLAEYDPNNVLWRASFAQSLAWSGMLVREREAGDPQVQSFFREALEIYQQLSVQDPNTDHYFDRIDAMASNLVDYYKATQQLGEAEELLRSNVAHHFDYSVRFAPRLQQHKRLATACEHLNQFLQSQARTNEAVTLCVTWLAELSKRFGNSAPPYYWHWTEALLHENLAQAAVAKLEYDRAVVEWRLSLNGLRDSELWSGHDPSEEISFALESLVSTQAKRGDLDAVLAAASETLDWLDHAPAKPLKLAVDVSVFITKKAILVDDGSGRIDDLIARCRRRLLLNPAALEVYDKAVPGSSPKDQEKQSPNTAGAQPPDTAG